MTDALDLYESLENQLDLAEKATRELAQRGADKAESERAYRVALAKKELYERSENHTPVSIMSDICRGDENVAALKVKRDCSDSLYDATKETIYLAKIRARLINDQINREYSNAGAR